MRRDLRVLTRRAGGARAGRTGVRVRAAAARQSVRSREPGDRRAARRLRGAGGQRTGAAWTGRPHRSAGLLGYQLFRKLVTDTAYVAITGIDSRRAPRASATFSSRTGSSTHYRLYYVFDRGIGNLPAEDVATPGPLEPWVADFGRRAVARMTADGAPCRIAGQPFGAARPASAADRRRLGSRQRRGLGVRPATARWWSTPRPPAAASRSRSPHRPGAIALDPVDGSAVGRVTTWISAVYHFRASGAVASPGELDAFENPLDIAVDPRRSIGVGVRARRQSRRVTSPPTARDGCSPRVLAPSRVAVDSLTHEVWVTSFSRGRVYRISNTTALERQLHVRGRPGGRGRGWPARAHLGGGRQRAAP